MDVVFVAEKIRLKRSEKTLTREDIQDWWVNKVLCLPENKRDTVINWLEYTYFNGNMPLNIKEWLINLSLKEREETDMKSLADVWMEEAKREGRREGRCEGEKRIALKIAQAMLAGGMRVDDIARFTGLTVDEILRMDG